METHYIRFDKRPVLDRQIGPLDFGLLDGIVLTLLRTERLNRQSVLLQQLSVIDALGWLKRQYPDRQLIAWGWVGSRYACPLVYEYSRQIGLKTFFEPQVASLVEFLQSRTPGKKPGGHSGVSR